MRRLERARASKLGEPASFDGFVFEEVLSILESAVDFRPEIPDVDRRGILFKAIKSAGTKTLDRDGLEKAVKAHEGEYLRQPKARFLLASSLSIANTLPPAEFSVNGVKIRLVHALPPRFTRTEIDDRIPAIVAEAPGNLTQVLATVSARTATAAFEHAKAGVDLLRALWNYSLTHRTYPIAAFLNRRPLNPILPGPVHTLHNPNGSLLKGTFWYECQSIQPSWVFNPKPRWPNALKTARSFRGRLTHIGYRADVESAFIRYARALDEADSSIAFTRLWGVLEHLAKAVGDYRLLVSRVAFLANDERRKFLGLLLEHLRDVRNEAVHTDQLRFNMATYLYQLKQITEMMFRYHLRNGKRFPSLAIAAEYLDTPTDRKILKQRLSNIRLALGERW